MPTDERDAKKRAHEAISGLLDDGEIAIAVSVEVEVAPVREADTTAQTPPWPGQRSACSVPAQESQNNNFST